MYVLHVIHKALDIGDDNGNDGYNARAVYSGHSTIVVLFSLLTEWNGRNAREYEFEIFFGRVSCARSASE